MKRLIYALFFIIWGGVTFGQESAENGLTGPMKKHGTTQCTAQLTPNVCKLFGVTPPAKCMAQPDPVVLDAAAKAYGERKIQKALIFNPDAIGERLLKKYPDDFATLLSLSDVVTRSSNVMPSVTPVNFSTIYTGADPQTHGRTFYNKELQKTPSLFDVFYAAQKKVAIIAQNGCSMDLIWREKPIDYYTIKDYEQGTEMAIVLLEKFDYDLIIVYDGVYDTVMHQNGVDSSQALGAMRDSLRRYAKLVEAVDKYWGTYDRLTVFASDHGSHDNESGKGTHGTDRTDDCIVNHCYRFKAASPIK